MVLSFSELNTVAKVAAGKGHSSIESHLESYLEMYHKQAFPLSVMSRLTLKYIFQYCYIIMLGMVEHTSNSSTWESRGRGN